MTTSSLNSKDKEAEVANKKRRNSSPYKRRRRKCRLSSRVSDVPWITLSVGPPDTHARMHAVTVLTSPFNVDLRIKTNCRTKKLVLQFAWENEMWPLLTGRLWGGTRSCQKSSQRRTTMRRAGSFWRRWVPWSCRVQGQLSQLLPASAIT